jgi:hypothetical protein
MGIGSNYLIDLIEEKYFNARDAWIRDHLGEDADENTPSWDELSGAFDEGHTYEDFEYDDWAVTGKSRVQIFNETIVSTRVVLKTSFPETVARNVFVMLYGYVVAAVEAYLATTFIDLTMSSDEHVRRLVETDPEFAKRTFTVKEIFTKNESLKDDVSLYLHGLIFHKVEKVKPMYKSVLGVDLGDLGWLSRAILLRHHCVHRAGYDKDGNEVEIFSEDIEQLIDRCSTLIQHVENKTEPKWNEIPF